ncbi:MAG: (2Fe-2S)-binding protein, partial [Elusimicrobia bacterium]|nr:(2Fe-2S)-binding protein [Elusimicrobiota bacterium]
MKISFILNGNKVNTEFSNDKPLLKMLREKFDVLSVKEGCGRGECGTCTLLLDGVPVAGCMVASGQVEGRTVTTLEGLKTDPIAENIIEAFIESGGVQCGFCTPGFIISSYALLKKNPSPSREEIKKELSGNICRCTGYT